MNFAFASLKDIIIIESYNSEFKWDADYLREIKKRFDKKYNVTTFQLDTKRLPLAEHSKIAQKAWALIESKKPVLVFLGDDAALKYLGQKLELKSIPTVYLGINNNPRTYFEKEPKYVTGVLERPLIRRSSLFIKNIVPQTTRVLILFDNDITSQIVHEDFFKGNATSFYSGVSFDFKLISQYSQFQKEIINAETNKYDAIIIGLYQALKDEQGVNVPAETVIKWSSQNAKKPIFGYWDFTIGKGKGVGGYVLSGTSQGIAAAELGQKILNNPKRLPFTYFPVFLQEGIFLFSKSELKRWKLTLPPEFSKEVQYVE